MGITNWLGYGAGLALFGGENAFYLTGASQDAAEDLIYYTADFGVLQLRLMHVPEDPQSYRAIFHGKHFTGPPKECLDALIGLADLG